MSWPQRAKTTVNVRPSLLSGRDFYYEGNRCAVFVDGSIHELDFVQQADQTKRRRLKALGYRIVEIRTKDIPAGLESLAACLGASA